MNPVKLCCGQHHQDNGPICPDGKVMCCLCFGRFELTDLAADPDEERVLTDVCKNCAVVDWRS